MYVRDSDVILEMRFPIETINLAIRLDIFVSLLGRMKEKYSRDAFDELLSNSSMFG